MKRLRLSDEQDIGIFQTHERGANCANLYRKHGMSEGTLYAWKSRFSRMLVPDIKQLKPLNNETLPAIGPRAMVE